MPATFQLLAAHPALDFINTLDNRFRDTGPTELLSGYAELLAFLEQTKLLDARQTTRLREKGASSSAAVRSMRRARDLREVMASVFYGICQRGTPPRESLKRFESYAVDAQRHRELIWTEPNASSAAGFRTAWVWGRFATQLQLPVWAITQSAADLLASNAIAHVHACASPTCRWLFLDISKNHSRRWCDMTLCGNRMKARRFQERH